MTSRFLSTVIPLAFLFVSGAWAQFPMAQCKAGFEWNRNSLGQDACLIGSMLDASCRGLVLYNYPPLNATQYYLPPRKDHSGDLMCDCNTVMYNLYMACSSCQGGQIYSWTMWVPACDSVYVTQYPIDIAQGTAVPRWAYYNITSLPTQTYNETVAISIGRDPEELPKQISTMLSESSTGTSGKFTLTKSSTGLPGPTNANGSNNITKGGTNVGAIVGGVVGSIVPLTILAVLVLLYMRHRRQQQGQQQQQQVLSPGAMDPYNQRQLSTYGPPVTTVPFTPYNPSDPMTFPPQSPPNSVTYTTPSHNTRGAYSGVPEI
ncbi:hypothetical protein BDM02DRAFT_2802311 [Thelephora ganbajun]|uniref:Uncharacterized protein n=1 Tax=Thelephora ganbajun TaxID=370292 RepID=A0ACB6ZDA9_THEGA|nr:hypothetical protein BDM02DRAFT_2802311 [Thelephora ganbajun]